MKSNKKLIIFTTLLMLTMLLAACGGNDNSSENSSDDNSGNNNDDKLEMGQEEISIPYVSWPSAIASSNVIKVALEEQGYDVTLQQVNSGAMYTGIADQTSEASVCVWLPNTDADYWEEYGGDIEMLGPNVEGTPLGLAVPEYMKDVNSIEDLADNTNSVGDETEWTITGIEPGSGQMELTKNQVMEDYGLDNWTLQASSSAAMATSLGEAINNQEPVVVTLWSPHWAFSKWDLKYLDDPQNSYGDPDDINTVVREGLEEDAPRAHEILNQFALSKSELESVMVEINNGTDPETAAQEWVNNNQDTVNEWYETIQ
ncbi:glycine betaine ABC transporter substrate-binding protein [Lentibacillus salicampi]|uniref:Glycine betaine ABC transporter substrate-binding protein n=1 Tax=Lentibacillus salicampi TaxID=175306 RepID=A0A4Y9A6C9_9BACI|nr:glycine betaine ABC transporter substrate-binding protein [Lentibacillus salicampi]TFJ90655.1 glycine betaine ABC transporter substrate-binding protein [Lentibacillus salicampi]